MEKALAGVLSKVTLLAVVMIAVSSLLLVAAGPAHAKTFTVNYTGDSEDSNTGDHICDIEGPAFACSLRAAIQQADITAGADTINFNIHPTDPNCDDSGVCTIAPDDLIEPLPRIDGPLTINGYSQPGAEANTNKGATNNANLKIELDGIMAADGSYGLFVQAPNCVVKGLVINRFEGNGVLLGEHASGTKVQGNFIGTDPAGTAALGNDDNGVIISHSSNNIIGGRYPGQRNVISGNHVGVTILSGNGNKVQGNRIGTDKNGSSDLGNVIAGVSVSGSDNFVGGSRSGQANVIANSFGDGVRISGDDSVRNRISRNSIHDNGVLGIDLGIDGETDNDDKDIDTGPNNLQNKPVLSSASTTGNSTTIQGTLNSTPNKTFVIRFFSNPPNGDEGDQFVGKKSVSTNANGNDSFSFSPAQAVPDGQTITATATNRKGNTSEFSGFESVT